MFWKTLQISWCTEGSVGAWELTVPVELRYANTFGWNNRPHLSCSLAAATWTRASVFAPAVLPHLTEWAELAGVQAAAFPGVLQSPGSGCVTSLSCQAKTWSRCWDNWHCSICPRCVWGFFLVQVGGDRTWKCLSHNCTKQSLLYCAWEHVKSLKTGTKTRNSGPKIQMVRDLFPSHSWNSAVF